MTGRHSAGIVKPWIYSTFFFGISTRTPGDNSVMRSTAIYLR